MVKKNDMVHIFNNEKLFFVKLFEKSYLLCNNYTYLYICLYYLKSIRKPMFQEL